MTLKEAVELTKLMIEYFPSEKTNDVVVKAKAVHGLYEDYPYEALKAAVTEFKKQDDRQFKDFPNYTDIKAIVDKLLDKPKPKDYIRMARYIISKGSPEEAEWARKELEDYRQRKPEAFDD
jgi:hypothetical protein